MEESERERLEQMLEAITLAGNADQVREEITELRRLADRTRKGSLIIGNNVFLFSPSSRTRSTT